MESIHIKLLPGENIFFTSDLHLGHKNVIQFCSRPWDNVEEMNEGLLTNLNTRVTNNDYIFSLGDLFWNKTGKLDFINRINSKKIYLIPGNHDYSTKINHPKVKNCDDIVKLSLSAEDWQERNWNYDSFEIWLCHYPMTTWPHRDGLRNFQLFGHIHSQIDKHFGFDQNLSLHTNQYDVGVDRNNWFPVSIEELLILFGYINNVDSKRSV